MNHTKVFRLASLVLLTICGTILGICLGCGTAELPQRFTVALFGQVTDQNGSALTVTIIDTQSGNEALTSEEDGTFDLLAELNGNQEVNLLIIQQGGAQTTLRVNELEANNEYELKIRYSTDINQATLLPASQPAPTPAPEGEEEPGDVEEGQATPVANPEPNGPFDENGNTTSFGIPAGLTGNLRDGRAEWRSRCQACHPEVQNGRGYNYRRLQRAIAQPPMNLDLPNRVLADITAYLNR